MFLEIKHKQGVFIAPTVSKKPTEAFKTMNKSFFLNLSHIKQIEFLTNKERLAKTDLLVEKEKNQDIEALIVFFEVDPTQEKPQGFTLLFLNTFDGVNEFKRIEKAIQNFAI